MEPVGSPRTLAIAGFGSSALMAASSYWVAAIPSTWRGSDTPVISLLPISGAGPRLAFYAGLTVLVLAWLLLGRLIITNRGNLSWRRLRLIAVGWVTPFVVAPPIGSRDLWAYAAQAQLLHHGLDPYKVGPAALPGRFAAQVSPKWSESATPYGPLWMTLTRPVAWINDPVAAVMVLRLLAVVGFALLAATLPTLAHRAGGSPAMAVWLVLANPLVLVLGVGGGHNDLVMVGLMALALVIVTDAGSVWRTLALAVVVATAAAAIKVPAVVAVAFLVPIWLHSTTTGPPLAKRSIALISIAVAAASIAIFAIITLLSGLGWGWIKQVNSSVPVVTWLSLPTLAAIGWKLLQGTTHGTTQVDATMRGLRVTGSVLALVLLAGGLLRALRSRAWALLAGGLLVVVILGPAVQPWYFCWALVVVAAIAIGRAVAASIAAASIALTLTVRPNGTGLQMSPAVIAIVAGSALMGWLVLGRLVLGREPAREPVKQ